MKRFGDILSVLFALALLGALGVGAYFALQFVIAPFTGLDKHVSTIIHAALVAALFCVFITALVVRWAQKRTSMDRMRPEQAEVYRCFLKAWSGVLNPHLTEDRRLTQRSEADLRAAEKHLILWGSSNMMKHYVAYQKLVHQQDPSDSTVLSLAEKVLLEMRKDLGQSNVGLNRGDLLGLLLDPSHHTHERDNTVRASEPDTRLPIFEHAHIQREGNHARSEAGIMRSQGPKMTMLSHTEPKRIHD